jgi:hypothetical protein
MKVTVASVNQPVESIVNTDTIVRFHGDARNTWIRFIDGSILEVLDPIEEITEAVLKADEKKAKNGLPTNQR